MASNISTKININFYTRVADFVVGAMVITGIDSDIFIIIVHYIDPGNSRNE